MIIYDIIRRMYGGSSFTDILNKMKIDGKMYTPENEKEVETNIRNLLYARKDCKGGDCVQLRRFINDFVKYKMTRKNMKIRPTPLTSPVTSPVIKNPRWGVAKPLLNPAQKKANAIKELEIAITDLEIAVATRQKAEQEELMETRKLSVYNPLDFANPFLTQALIKSQRALDKANKFEEEKAENFKKVTDTMNINYPDIFTEYKDRINRVARSTIAQIFYSVGPIFEGTRTDPGPWGPQGRKIRRKKPQRGRLTPKSWNNSRIKKWEANVRNVNAREYDILYKKQGYPPKRQPIVVPAAAKPQNAPPPMGPAPRSATPNGRKEAEITFMDDEHSKKHSHISIKKGNINIDLKEDECIKLIGNSTVICKIIGFKESKDHIPIGIYFELWAESKWVRLDHGRGEGIIDINDIITKKITIEKTGCPEPAANTTGPSQEELDAAYNVLGVERGANIRRVRREYVKLVREHHPDKGGNPTRFTEIQSAFEKLSAALPAAEGGFSRTSKKRKTIQKRKTRRNNQ